MKPEPAARRAAVRVRSSNGPHPVKSVRVRRMAVRMLKALERADAELSVLLVDDAKMRGLNKLYRGLDRSTDVLSFAMQEGDFAGVDPGLLGDVVIAVPTAQRQAKRARHDLEQEVAQLLAHGLLHLLGYEHDTKAGERRMTAETRRLVEAASG
jgi:probable rRNA maturation factor